MGKPCRVPRFPPLRAHVRSRNSDEYTRRVGAQLNFLGFTQIGFAVGDSAAVVVYCLENTWHATTEMRILQHEDASDLNLLEGKEALQWQHSG